MDEITPLFLKDEDPPMTVRARSVEDDRKSDGVETEHLARKITKQLIDSPLFLEGSLAVQERILALSDDYEGVAPEKRATKRRTKVPFDRRSLESMILRSANLVFATTNSAAVETLIQDKGLFDWSIVEEAGKATGSELISPMLLSHRRLMIGDHKQLPPFDSERIVELLKTPTKIQLALSLVKEMVSRDLRDTMLNELLEDIRSDEADVAELSAMALRFLTLFGTLIDEDIGFLKTRPSLRPIARRLNEQHRMHPAISRIVSQCFYDGELKDYAKRAEKFRTQPSPVSLVIDGLEIRAPVVFVDMPYSRETHKNRNFNDSQPSWHNPSEVDAVVNVLSSLRPMLDKPTLAILSPYMEQVRRLRSRIWNDQDHSHLDLSGFTPAIGAEFCGTVDSFQGGQADCVVVSLVRNNVHTNPDKALGFLTKSHRMNVLLSRAKSQLVLVGSMKFFEYVLSHGDLEGTDLTFLRTLMTLLREGAENGIKIIPYPIAENR